MESRSSGTRLEDAEELDSVEQRGERNRVSKKAKWSMLWIVFFGVIIIYLIWEHVLH
jgi:hypothetical protein